MKKQFLFFFFVCFATLLFSQELLETNCFVADPKGEIRNHNVDFETLLLDVRFEPEKGIVHGNANYSFIPIQQKVDTLFLDGPGIEIKKVKLNQQAINYRVDSAGVTLFFNPALTWETSYQLEIEYTATPRKGIYFIGWKKESTAKDTDPDRIRKQIWTQGQGVDNRFWIPSYDGLNDKLITALTITFDQKYKVISNGNLIQEIENGDHKTKTWRYAMDHPHMLYLIMLAIGEYDSQDFVSKNGIVSKQYYYPDRKDAVESSYNHSAEMMDFIEKEVGVKYPWKTYANIPVQEFLYGAMENTTATIFTDFYLQNPNAAMERGYAGINAHELTHQWFGDYISAIASKDHWLQESFATYYSKMFMRSIDGEDAYAWNKKNEMSTAINADNQNENPVAHSQAGSARHYQKGSFVIGMMRYVVGDAQFQKVIKDFLQTNPYQSVTSIDFEMQFMKTLGINMHWFFDEWIYKSGYPIYEVQYEMKSDFIEIEIKQTQKITETVGLFKMPIQIQINFEDDMKQDTLVWIENAETTIQLPNKKNKPIEYVLFDVGKNVISKVNFKKTFPELEAQAISAENYIDRYFAVLEMKELDIETKKETLLKVYAKETHHGIKAEIIAQLIAEKDKAIVQMIQSGIQDKNPTIRKAVLQSTTTVSKNMEKYYVPLLQDSSYVNIELALRILSREFPNQKENYLILTENMFGMNKNIRCVWLEIDYSINKTKNIAELTNYASHSYEFRTRNNAFNSLRAINYCDETVVVNLFDAAISSNSRLAGPARSVLQYFLETPEYQTMIKKAFETTNWKDLEKARIELIFKKK